MIVNRRISVLRRPAFQSQILKLVTALLLHLHLPTVTEPVELDQTRSVIDRDVDAHSCIPTCLSPVIIFFCSLRNICLLAALEYRFMKSWNTSGVI